MQATRVREGQIPSSSTGEQYDLVEYSNGAITCTCPFGIRRGMMATGDRNCKHAKAFRRTPGGGLALEGQKLSLPPAFSVADLTGDSRSISARVALLLAAAFAPMAYLKDVADALLLQDDEEREKQSNGEEAKPLTEEQRVIVEYLCDNFGAWVNYHLSTDSLDSEDDPLLATAETITKLALKHRPRTEVNSDTAEWLMYFLQYGKEIHDTALFVKDLGIPGIASEKARLVAQKYASVEALYATKEEDLKKIDGIGPVLANNIAKGLMEHKNRLSEPDSKPTPPQR